MSKLKYKTYAEQRKYSIFVKCHEPSTQKWVVIVSVHANSACKRMHIEVDLVTKCEHEAEENLVHGVPEELESLL